MRVGLISIYEVVVHGKRITPKPDLEAHRNSLMLPMPEVLRTLTSNIGKKLTAFIASADDTEMIESWIAGEPHPVMRRNGCALPIKS